MSLEKRHQVGTGCELSFVEVVEDIDAKGVVEIVAEGEAPIKPADRWEVEIFQQAIGGINAAHGEAAIGGQTIIDEFDQRFWHTERRASPVTVKPVFAGQAWARGEPLVDLFSHSLIWTEQLVGCDAAKEVSQRLPYRT